MRTPPARPGLRPRLGGLCSREVGAADRKQDIEVAAVDLLEGRQLLHFHPAPYGTIVSGSEDLWDDNPHGGHQNNFTRVIVNSVCSTYHRLQAAAVLMMS